MQFDQEFKIGQRVTVNLNPAQDWTKDWQNATYVVTGARLEYQNADPQVNYSIATPEEIEHRLGDTDGFYAASLALA